MAGETFQGVAVDPATNTLVPTTTQKSDWSTRTPTPEEAAALGNVETAQAQQQQVAEKEQELAQQRDLDARLVADQKAQDAIKNQQALEKAHNDYKEERARIQAEVVELSKQKAKAAQYGDYWSDKTTGHRVLAAIAAGLSQGSTIMAGGSGPGPVQLYYQHAQELDQKAKKDRLESIMDDLKSKGASLKSLDDFHENALKHIEADRLAQDRSTAAYIEGLGAAYPQFAQQAAKAAADLKAQSAEKMFTNTAAIHEQRNSGGTSVTSPNAASVASAGKKSESEQKNYLLGTSMKAEIEAIRKGEQLTSKDLDQIQRNTLAAEAADKSAESGQVAGAGVAIGRGLGVVPKSRYSGLSAGKQKTLNAWDNAIEKYARVLTGAGMPAEEARRMARQNGPAADDTPATIKFKLDRLDREADSMIGLSKNAANAMGVTPQVQQTPQTAPKINAATKGMSAEHRAALKWAAANPKDPRAKQVIAKVRQEAGQ